jgi:hypothetical protein
MDTKIHKPGRHKPHIFAEVKKTSTVTGKVTSGNISLCGRFTLRNCNGDIPFKQIEQHLYLEDEICKTCQKIYEIEADTLEEFYKKGNRGVKVGVQYDKKVFIPKLPKEYEKHLRKEMKFIKNASIDSRALQGK